MRRAIAAGVGAVSLLIVGGSPGAAAPPDGFSEEVVAAVPLPTALAFTPDGRMLITSQPGQLFVLPADQSGEPKLALDLSAQTCSNSERGLLGVAVDPKFDRNRRIYLYSTFKRGGTCPQGQPQTDAHPVNRVVRFTLGDDNVVQPRSAKVLVDNMPSPNGNHNGGDLNFGPEGALYVSVGDGGCDYAGGGCAGTNDAARDLNVLSGKILRIKTNGDPAKGNPFKKDAAKCGDKGMTSKKSACREIWATGLRNPFRFAFDSAGSRLYINDVGQSRWEEIDEGAIGADYGWNLREGHCTTGSTTECPEPPPELTDPIFDYGREDGCGSITGAAFVPPGVWPSDYEDVYLFGDFNCRKIFGLRQDGSAPSRFEVVSDAGPVVHLEFGPWQSSQALYYTTYADGGQVRRVAPQSATGTA